MFLYNFLIAACDIEVKFIDEDNIHKEKSSPLFKGLKNSPSTNMPISTVEAASLDNSLCQISSLFVAPFY